MHHRTMICLAALVCIPGFVRAADLTFTQNFVADFEFDIPATSPINPYGVDTGWQPYQAAGALTFTIAASINDPTQTTVAITNVQGTLNGVYPASLVPYTISPDLQFLSGDLTNIVRDGSGNIISANVSDLSMRWDLIAFGGGLTLYTLDGLPFNGAVTSLPFTNGTVLSGPDQFNVYVKDANNDDVLAALGRDRTLTAVPEPTSAALAAMAALTVAAFMTRRWKSSVNE